MLNTNEIAKGCEEVTQLLSVRIMESIFKMTDVGETEGETFGDDLHRILFHPLRLDREDSPEDQETAEGLEAICRDAALRRVAMTLLGPIEPVGSDDIEDACIL